MASFFLGIPWNYVELCSPILKRQTLWQLWELSNTSGCCGADAVFWCPRPLITCLSWLLFCCLHCVPALTAFLHLLTRLPILIDSCRWHSDIPNVQNGPFSNTGAISKLSISHTLGDSAIVDSVDTTSTKWKHLRASLTEKGSRQSEIQFGRPKNFA